MHLEYAVEPAAIGESWTTFKDLFDRFGTDKGRLITRMPNKWEGKVMKAAKAAGVRDVDKERILLLLHGETRHKVASFHRSYGPNQNWIGNALGEHDKVPFRAIICTSGADLCDVALSPDLCTDDHTLFNTPTSRDVVRVPEKIAEELLPISKASENIDIVDPYFVHEPSKRKCIEPLKILFAGLANSAGPPKSILVHYDAHSKNCPTVGFLVQHWDKVANEVVPEGYSLELHGWSEQEDGENLHDRYFLTDIGGITIGAGFSAEGPTETTVFALMDFQHAQSLRERFSPTSIVYNKVGSTVQIDSKGAKILDE